VAENGEGREDMRKVEDPCVSNHPLPL